MSEEMHFFSFAVQSSQMHTFLILQHFVFLNISNLILEEKNISSNN